MLILTRKIGQRIRIGDDIIIEIGHYERGHVRVGIDAPRNVPVHREEIWQAIQQQRVQG